MYVCAKGAISNHIKTQLQETLIFPLQYSTFNQRGVTGAADLDTQIIYILQTHRQWHTCSVHTRSPRPESEV